jgi:hypothetical protein
MKHITIGIVLLRCRASLCWSKNASTSQIGSLAPLIGLVLAVYSFLAGILALAREKPDSERLR